jgi:hypothetical protein
LQQVGAGLEFTWEKGARVAGNASIERWQRKHYFILHKLMKFEN